MEKEIEHTFLVDKTPGANDYTSFKRGYELGIAAERAKLDRVIEAAKKLDFAFRDEIPEPLRQANLIFAVEDTLDTFRNAGLLTEEGK